MDTRQLCCTVHHVTSPWVVPSPLTSVRSVRHCAGLGAHLQFISHDSSRNNNSSTHRNEDLLTGSRISHITRVAQWSTSRSGGPNSYIPTILDLHSHKQQLHSPTPPIIPHYVF
ncbi:hypothetical protein Vafri_11222 [Volvox africanus]|nr:hypothetical protein Vafri_11222 [Volvox africanus]